MLPDPIPQFTRDDRGVSEVIGAILVFGLLIALLAVMQTYAVPLANEEVEFNHNQDVQSDLVSFQEAASEVATDGTSATTKIRMGTTYPTRLVFFNPQNPGGELRTTESGTVNITNVNATDPVVAKHFGGSLTGLDTRHVEYEPNYNEYRQAPTVTLEYGTVYRDFGDETVIDNPGRVVSGNTISMTFFDGELARTSGRPLSMEAQPVSAPARTVSVEAENPSDNITIRLPTQLSASEWNTILDDEDNVVGVRDVDGENAVLVDLDGSETYNLRMSKIGVGSGIEEPEAAYIAPVRTQTIQTAQANRLPLEVRDAYNNPVSGETVNLSVDSGEFQNEQQTIESRTLADGQPAAQYFAGDTGTVTIEASYVRKPSDSSFDPENNPEDFRMQITFNPNLDTVDPSINSYQVSNSTYTVCGETGEFASLTCTANANQTIQMYQVTAEYDISDDGGAGLSHLNLRIYDSSGTLITESSQSAAGASMTGRFVSPLFPAPNQGEPAEVEIIVYDNNGNRDSDTQSL